MEESRMTKEEYEKHREETQRKEHPDDYKNMDIYLEPEFKKYVEEKRWTKKIKARDLWFKILDSQMETGTPYILFKDSANRKSNQQNLGIIKSSNLCTEIIEYTSPEESAVCNLASISLSKFGFCKTTLNKSIALDFSSESVRNEKLL